MAICVECESEFADTLHRCPSCGCRAEAQAPRPGIAYHEAYPEPGQRVRRIAIRNWIIAAGAIGAVVAVVLAIGHPGSIEAGALTALPSVSRPTLSVSRPAEPRKSQGGIRPGRLEDALHVEQAVLVGDYVIVSGTVAPNAVVSITLAGSPVPISADGKRFQALFSRRKTSFELVVEDIDGKQRREQVLVSRPDGEESPAISLVRHLDGQTFHQDSLVPDTAEEAKPIALDRVETFIRLPARVMRVYRAPAGFTYLRTTRTGEYSFLRGRDSQEMVLIPAGIARRGFGKTAPHGPQHIVRLSPYLIDRTEITCAQYSRFLVYMARVGDPSLRHRDDRMTTLRPLGWKSDLAPAGTGALPVTGVAWYGAYAYCRWVGGRLPREAEWERAAAGARGFHFPWGDDFEAKRCNAQSSALMPSSSMLDGESVYGLLHTCGNAREWCSDRYGSHWYEFASSIDPRGPANHKHRVVRGGSHLSALNDLVLQVRSHEAPQAKPEDIGFRVAQSWPSEIR